jgi:hypothetical protein
MNSVTSARFWRLYRQLPSQIRQAARDAYQQFAANPAHPGLHFQRLQYDPRLWSVRVTSNYRAVGIRHGDTITWFWIGDHEEFDKTFSLG